MSQFYIVFIIHHRTSYTFYISENDVKYGHCVCIKESPYMTATGCPPGMVPVTKCPPKIPRRVETCCAQIVLTKQKEDKTHTDNKQPQNKETHTPPKQKLRKSPIIKQGSIIRMLRVFDG